MPISPDNPYAQFAAKPNSPAPSPAPSLPASGGANPYAQFAAQKPPAESLAHEPETTAGGLAASATRGMAPYAAGAAVGAGIGGVLVPGIGAIPGAVAGAGAVGLADLAGAVYSPVARALGLPDMARPRDLTDAGLDAMGVRRPSTDVERITEATTGGAAGALTGAGAAGQVAERLAAGTTGRAVATRLAEGPVRQAVSGAAGGATGQVAAEMGADPTTQYFASMAGGGLPYAGAGARASIATEPRQTAVAAHGAGYVLPPAMASEHPGVVNDALAGWSGKIKTAQAASDANQSVTNRLAARQLGLPDDTVLTPQVFAGVRQRAGAAYQAVIAAVPHIQVDHTYDTTIAGLGGANSHAALHFPHITNNPGIAALIKELRGATNFPTEAGVEVVKELRYNGNANLKAHDDPSRHALGLAQRQAADAIDDLMDRRISAAGQPDIINQYRAARMRIAQSYDIEGPTNFASGDVNAHGLARLADRGRPLTGDLRTIAETAAAFPRATRTPSSFGNNENWSALDFFGSAAAAAHGNFGVAGAIALRPAARAGILSRPYQRAMVNPQRSPAPLSLITDPGYRAIVDPAGTNATSLGAQ